MNPSRDEEAERATFEVPELRRRAHEAAEAGAAMTELPGVQRRARRMTVALHISRCPQCLDAGSCSRPVCARISAALCPRCRG